VTTIHKEKGMVHIVHIVPLNGVQ